MHIGPVNLAYGVMLAPLAGVADGAMRALCREFGAEMTVSEMVSAKALCFGDKKSAALMRIAPAERPCSIQLFGREPELFARAARLALEYEPDAIDINMGCPAPKITRTGEGGALMREPQLCADIVAAVRAAVDLPLTVKLRAGWDGDSINAPLIAELVRRAGADAVVVHGRTVRQLYTGHSDHEVIRAVKSAADMPVIANGDIATGEDAERILRLTGCDGVMIGRAAMGNPFVFEDVRSRLAHEPRPAKVTAERRLAVARRHIEAMAALHGERAGMLMARKHLGWYLKGMHGAAALRARASAVATLEDVHAIIDDALSSQAVE